MSYHGEEDEHFRRNPDRGGGSSSSHNRQYDDSRQYQSSQYDDRDYGRNRDYDRNSRNGSQYGDDHRNYRNESQYGDDQRNSRNGSQYGDDHRNSRNGNQYGDDYRNSRNGSQYGDDYRSNGRGRGYNGGGRGNGRGNYGNRGPPNDAPQRREEDIKNIAKRELAYNFVTFAERPAKMVYDMKLGKKSVVLTNFVKISLPQKNIVVHQYNIRIVSSQGKKRQEETKKERAAPLFWEFVQRNPDIFPPPEDLIFNDVNILWSKEQLKIGGQQTFQMKKEGARDSRTFTEVEIKYTGGMGFSRSPELKDNLLDYIGLIDGIATARVRCPLDKDFNQFVSSKNITYWSSQEMRSGHAGDTNLTLQIGGGLEAWTGLHVAIKTNLRVGHVANIDISHSVFLKSEYSLVHQMLDIVAGHHLSEEEFEDAAHQLQNRGVNESNCKTMSNLLKGIRVKILSRDKFFKFDGLCGSADKTTFMHEGNVISVSEYYEKYKNHRLRFPGLPCVIGPKNTNAKFPMETVVLSDTVQKFKGRIPNQEQSQMVRLTAFPAQERLEIIKRLSVQNPEPGAPPALVSSNDKWMKNFEINIDNELLTTGATLLPPPTLVYGNSTFTDENHKGIWEAANKSGFRTVLSATCEKTGKRKVIVPSLISVVQRRSVINDATNYQSLLKCVERFGQPVLKNESGKFYEIAYTGHYKHLENGNKPIEGIINGIQELQQVLNDIKNHAIELFANSKTEIGIPLVLFIFDSNCTTLNQYDVTRVNDYGVIKQLCDSQIGINCQGIMRKTYMAIQQNINTCATGHNVAFKILGKIGTIHYQLQSGGNHKNWTKFTDPEEPTLVLGVDVTHPSAQNRRVGDVNSASVAAVVGNIDIAISKFRSSFRVQQCGQEMIVEMAKEVEERIIAFQEHTGKRPAHIVVYRDGVSESEFKRVMHTEKDSIIKACKKLNEDYEPTLTYIVITKRHHTRFFPMNAADAEGEAGNVKPGLLVEGDITTKDYFDFYITSQLGAIGTSRPTHYYVLHDSWRPSDAFWQTITFCLCYNYTRTTKSISVPAPVLYAHYSAIRAKDKLVAFTNIAKNTGRPIDINEFRTLLEVNEKIAENSDLQGNLSI